MYMRLGVWRIGGMGYNFVKNVDLFFFEKYTPLPRGMGVYFQSNICIIRIEEIKLETTRTIFY